MQNLYYALWNLGENLKIRDEYTCPLELTHDITKGKWKPIILWQLGKVAMSLSQLENNAFLDNREISCVVKLFKQG